MKEKELIVHHQQHIYDLVKQKMKLLKKLKEINKSIKRREDAIERLKNVERKSEN